MLDIETIEESKPLAGRKVLVVDDGNTRLPSKIATLLAAAGAVVGFDALEEIFRTPKIRTNKYGPKYDEEAQARIKAHNDLVNQQMADKLALKKQKKLDKKLKKKVLKSI